jgi:hypothetical protein
MEVASALRVSRLATAALATAAIVVLGSGTPTGATGPARTPSQSRAVPHSQVVSRSRVSSQSRVLPRTRAVPHSGVLPPRNPPKNLPPDPNFYAYCASGALDDTVACNSKALQAINRARASERIGSLRFNLANFLKLSVADQLFVIADLERVSRGEPPMTALTIGLDKVAQAGAGADTDPISSARKLPGGSEVRAWGSNWAGGSENALGSDDGWMYNDGFGSDNGACPYASAAGCWGHRDNILRVWTSDLAGCPAASSQLVMGAAYARSSKWTTSFAEIFLAACGPEPTGQVYTWTQAQAAIGIK